MFALLQGDSETPESGNTASSGAVSDSGDELDDGGYFDRMSFAFSTFWNEIEACQAADDQHCQTETIRTLHGDTDYLPATVGWMEQAHGDLRSALEVMLDLNERSEVEEITPAFLSESQAAVAELARAIDEWIITAEQ